MPTPEDIATLDKLGRKIDDTLEMYREVVGYVRELRTEKRLSDDRWDTVVSRLERMERRLSVLTSNGSGGGDHV